jgi:hypothetical protein
MQRIEGLDESRSLGRDIVDALPVPEELTIVEAVEPQDWIAIAWKVDRPSSMTAFLIRMSLE